MLGKDVTTPTSILAETEEPEKQQVPPFRYVPDGTYRDHLTQAGNSRRFAKEFGDVLRYVRGLGWVGWNGEHWEVESDIRAIGLAKEAALNLYNASTDLARSNSPTEKAHAAPMFTWARRSETGPAIREVINLARPELLTHPSAFDSDPVLFNLKNGTLDLRTGELQERDRADYITRISPIRWEGIDAPCPLWDAFLRTVTEDNEELMRYLQQTAGYALTGVSNSPQWFFFLHGDSGKDKSTYLETLLGVLGDDKVTGYAHRLNANDITVKAGTDYGLADLQGRRLAWVNETEAGQRLNERRLKEMTGDSAMSVRGIRKEPATIQITWKLWIVSNFEPRLDGADDALWDRCRKIPFDGPKMRGGPDEVFEYHKTLLAEEGPGILAWAVRGCLDWQERKMKISVPKVVMQASEAYRNEQDPVYRWLEARCVPKPGHFTRTDAMRDDFMDWATDEGHTLLAKITMQSFAQRIKGSLERWTDHHGVALEKGTEDRKARGAAGWFGVAL